MEQEPNEDSIDLGEEQSESPMMEKSEQQPSYPSVMLSGNHNLSRIADKGIHKIHARVISRHMPSKGNKHHRVELEIHKITPQMKRGAKSKSPSDADAESMKNLLKNVPE